MQDPRDPPTAPLDRVPNTNIIPLTIKPGNSGFPASVAADSPPVVLIAFTSNVRDNSANPKRNPKIINMLRPRNRPLIKPSMVSERPNPATSPPANPTIIKMRITKGIQVNSVTVMPAASKNREDNIRTRTETIKPVNKLAMFILSSNASKNPLNLLPHSLQNSASSSFSHPQLGHFILNHQRY